jgi:hypothetical protein
MFFSVVFAVSVVAEEIGELGIYLCVRPLERFEPSSGRGCISINNCDFQPYPNDNSDIMYVGNKWKERLGHCFLVLARYLGSCDAADGSGRLKILRRESAFGFGGTGTSGKSGDVFPEGDNILHGNMPIAGMRLFSKHDLFPENQRDSAIDEIFRKSVDILNEERSRGYSHFCHNCCTVTHKVGCFIINNIINSISVKKDEEDIKYTRHKDVLAFLKGINFDIGLDAWDGDYCQQLPTAKPRPGPRPVWNF